MSNLHLSTSPATLKEQKIHHDMSQGFLGRLLSTPENRVQSESCMICLEDFNTLNTSTGIIECGIRLPCGHLAGSSCIVTWLQANNNCPACRKTFFPAQPHPQHGIIDADRPRAAPVSLPTEIVEILDSLIVDIYLAFGERDNPYPILNVARLMASHLIDSIRDQSHRSIAVVSIYMASHIVRRPKYPTEISRAAGVDPHLIRAVYRQIYPIRMQVIDIWALESIAGGDVEGMLAFLPPPDRTNGIIDNEGEQHELQRQNVPLHPLLDEVRNLCSHHSMGLGVPSAYAISREIAREILLEHHPSLRSPPLVAAIGLYMASHLLGHQTSYRLIADTVRIDEGTLGTAYARVYPLRNQLIKPRMLVNIGLENLPRALEALPALNWPPL